jgi:methyl-accepting chemotaxis protein
MTKIFDLLSIPMRLTGVGLIVAVLASVGGLSGAYRIWSLGNHFRAYEDLAGDALLASELNADMAKVLLNAREYLVTRSDEDLVDTRRYLAEVKTALVTAAKELHAQDRRELVARIVEKFDHFEKGFERVVVLLTERDKIVNDVLDRIGPQIRAQFTKILEASLQVRDSETAVLAGTIQEDLLIARLYIAKFLLNNKAEEADRVRKEFTEFDTRFGELSARLRSNPASANVAALLDAILPLVKAYREGFGTVQTIIEERNDLRSSTLDKDGAEISAWAAQIKNSAVGSEVELSAKVLSAVKRDELWVLATVFLSLVAAIALSWGNGRRLSRQISEIVSDMNTLADGDTSILVTAADQKHEIGQIGRALLAFRDAAFIKTHLETEASEQRHLAEEMRRQTDAERSRIANDQARIAAEQATFIEQLGSSLHKLSNGQLDARLDENNKHGFGPIADDFNRMAAELRDIVRRIEVASQAVDSATKEIGNGVEDLALRTEHQASTLRETASFIDKLSTTVHQNASDAGAANRVAAKARGLAEGGGNIAGRAIAAMGKIETSSHQISEFVTLIEEIAFQTNILALNAAVEAARAGDAGRGFAVVADEVRALSQRSARALAEIKTQITASNANVGEGVGLVKQADTALKDIVAAVTEVAKLVSQIAAANQEQTSSIDQVGYAVSGMDRMTQQNAVLAEDTSSALEIAQSRIADLREAVDFFRSAPLDDAPSEAATEQPAMRIGGEVPPPPISFGGVTFAPGSLAGKVAARLGASKKAAT